MTTSMGAIPVNNLVKGNTMQERLVHVTTSRAMD